ncbi:MAG: hypothetical protein KC731_17285 [Myxococcales bacterium]|nr:hypothetical protein [Myxococcales bacterium]
MSHTQRFIASLVTTLVAAFNLLGCAEGDFTNGQPSPGPMPDYDGLYTAELRANLDPTSSGDEAYEGVALELLEPMVRDEAWGGEAALRLAIVAPAESQAEGEEEVEEIVAWADYDGVWTQRRDYAAPDFSFSVTCISTEAVTRPELGVTCSSEAIVVELRDSCRQPAGTDVFLCENLYGDPIAKVAIELHPAD